MPSRRPACLEGPAVAPEVNSLHEQALEHCVVGLSPIWESPVVHFDAPGRREIGKYHLDAPSCIRLLGVASPNTAEVSVTLRDDRRQLLATSSAQSLVLAPAGATLCLPQATDVFIEVGSDVKGARARVSLLRPTAVPAKR
jgi:hypothetical protein